MKKYFVMVCLWAFVAQSQAKSDGRQIDQILHDLFGQAGPGGAALVVKDGKTIYRKAFGMANLELNVKMTPEHIFRVGSITKQFTAVAILQLVEAGKIDLDADITEYIKDYPTHGHHISIKHLLNHTSGIKSYTGMSKWDHEVHKKDFTPSALIDFFKNEPMDFAPGEQFKYNNSGYILLGHIIELVSGESYADYIENHIFKPLNMNHSSYGSTSKIINNRAYGYAQADGEYKNADFLSMTQPYAAGSLLSTVDDIHTWYKAIMADQVISQESRAMAHQMGVLNNGEKIGYGFGWNIGNLQGSPMIEHGGGINGFLTASLILPQENVFVAVFSNCMCNYPGDAVNEIAAIVIDKPFAFEKISLDEALLQSYQGVYEITPDNTRIITFDEGKLFSMRTGGAKYEIHPFAKDQFFFEDSILSLIFNRNEAGEIQSVTMKSTGQDQTWIKTDKPIPSVNAIEMDPTILAKYVGKYELAPEFHINLFITDGVMYAQATGQQKNELVATAMNQFTLKNTDIKLTINMDNANQVEGLTLHQNGHHEAKKVE
ncbi:serine hydrolase domain-containing protein [Marinicella litoralis]|uniref:CubicO group peptidase (Beta-lactamase class C family) n=1 Tax=Marinicella litoralis TaxID=644220 RepID=A0A4R6Y0X8_9GAMM|nr:serine hydrolase domain-containing protein [Marinicella litoralis]TDR22588.1 CubicO group peptidase (beta-lactamase class C family) [Marinicella litoralis]